MEANERPNHSDLTPGVDVDIERAGAGLHIPQDEWQNPAVQELIGFIVRVDELQKDFFNAATDSARDEVPAFLDGAHVLADRYYTSEQLLRVIAALLREGLSFWATRQEPGSTNFHYLTEKLDNALRPYGLAVTPQPKAS
jgi:hypothetical protein